MGKLIVVGNTSNDSAEGVPTPQGEIITVQSQQGLNPCLLNQDIYDCGYSSPGIRRIFIARRSEVKEYYFFIQNNRNKIKSIAPVQGRITWRKIFSDTAKFSESKTDTVSGPAFSQKLDLQFGPMKWESRGKLRPLIGPEGHVVIFEDRNGRWWLAGESEGLKNANRLTETGDRFGRNGYDITLASTELNPIREIDSEWVRINIIDPPKNAATAGAVGSLGNLIVSDFRGIKIIDL